MANYIACCPNCKRNASDIGWSASYFDIYECSNCRTWYCYNCRNSNGARRCPECEDTEGHHRTVATVSKS